MLVLQHTYYVLLVNFYYLEPFSSRRGSGGLGEPGDRIEQITPAIVA